MPKHCEECRFYSVDNTPTTCPNCQTSLRFTFQPPAGQNAAPMENVNTAPSESRPRQKEGFLDSLGIPPRVLAGAFAVLLAIGGYAVRHSFSSDQSADVKPGMHISTAARLLDTGKGMHHPNSVRFRDRFAPDDDSDGEYTLEANGAKVVVRWEDGIVTSVDREGGSSGGMRRSRTTVSD